MAKTYAELILECQNYDYSKENYELTKECCELQLMSQYIESQQFMVENMAEIREEFTEFDESYFIESATDEDVTTMTETVDKKSKNLFKKIWKGFKSICKKIAGFFTKLFNRSKKTTDKNAELKKMIESLPNDVINAAIDGTVKGESEPAKDGEGEDDKASNEAKTEVTVNIKAILENAWKEEYRNEGFVIADNQPYAKHINSKAFRNKKNKHALNMLAAALSDTEVVIKLTGEKKILSIDELVYVFDTVSQLNSESSEKDVTEVKKYINDALKKVLSKGIVVKVDPKHLDDTKAKLDEISAKMEEFMKESTDEDVDLGFLTEAAKSKKADKEVKMSFDDFKNGGYKEIMASITGLKDVYSDVMNITGNMMKLYNFIENYRTTVGTQLGTALVKLNAVVEN